MAAPCYTTSLDAVLRGSAGRSRAYLRLASTIRATVKFVAERNDQIADRNRAPFALDVVEGPLGIQFSPRTRMSCSKAGKLSISKPYAHGSANDWSKRR
jgi:hypothetical protein